MKSLFGGIHSSTIKKISIIIVCILAIGCFVPFLTPYGAMKVYGAESDMFDELGFDTENKPDGYKNDGNNPYGKNTIAINPVSELYYSNNENAVWSKKILGHNAVFPDTTVTPGATTGNSFDARQTAVGDFTGSGKKSCIVALGANTAENKTKSDRPEKGLYLYFIDPLTGAESASPLKLYGGEIGNQFELEGGYLRYDSVSDYNYSSGKDGSGFYNQALLHNYMEIVTGDFTGDGVDEIAVYVPDSARPRIEVYQLKYSGSKITDWRTLNNWQLIFTYDLKKVSGYAPNMLSMATGDIDYDGIDDLAIGCGSKNYQNQFKASVGIGGSSAGEVKVLFSTGRAETFKAEVNVPYEGLRVDAVKYPLTNFGLTFGDLTGSGRDRLIIADTPVTEEHSNDYRWAKIQVNIESWRYDVDAGKFVRDDIGVSDHEIARDFIYPHVRADAAAVSQGMGMADALYYRGFLFTAAGGELTCSEENVYDVHADKLRSLYLRDKNYEHYLEHGAVAVDLDGDFKQEIVVSYSPMLSDNDGPMAGPAQGAVFFQGSGGNLDVKADYVFQDKRELLGYFSDPPYRHLVPGILLAVPDTDEDTMLLKYKEQHLVYSDPKILAVIAGAPVYKSLEHLDKGDGYIGESGTEWAVSKGTGTGQTSATQFDIGLYFGYEHEAPLLGSSAFKIEMELAYSHGITWETEKRSTITETVGYGAPGYTDNVALYSVPMSVYTYEAVIPTTLAGTQTDTQEFSVNVPYMPAVVVMTVDEYEQIVEGYKGVLPSIREDGILTHTQGDPGTYPKSSSGFRDATVYSGDFAQVGYGNSSQRQTISIEQEETKSTTHSDSLSFKLGGGAGGIKAGITAGFGFEYGKAKITTSGSEFTGTVFGMPPEARGYGYNYSWKIMQYWHYFDEKSKIPVVSYLVNAPTGGAVLAVPQNLDIDVSNSTTESLQLTWDYPKQMGIDGFKVFRLDTVTGEYTALPQGSVAYIPGTGSYGYTDAGLLPGALYTYRVQAVRQSGANSVLSPAASGWTLAEAGVSLTLSQSSLTAYPDKSYTINSTLAGVSASGAVNYSWEKFVNGKWTEIGINTKTLTMNNVKPSAAGEYRLRASMSLGGTAAIVYSKNTLSVDVEKRMVNIDLYTGEDAGPGGSSDLVLTAVLQNTVPKTESLHIPGGSVTFAVTFDGGEVNEYTAELAVDPISGYSTAGYRIPEAKEGLYSVSVRYAGNSVFSGADAGPLDYLKAAHDHYFVNAPQMVYYGDSITPKFWKASGNGTSVTYEDLSLNPDYMIELTSIKQQVVSGTVVFGYWTGGTVSWADATPGTVYRYEDGMITPLLLNPKNIEALKYGFGNSYHFIATFRITGPGLDTAGKTLAIPYRVDPRPVSITALNCEFTQSQAAGPLGADNFIIAGPNGDPAGFGRGAGWLFENVLRPRVLNNAGIEVTWGSELNLGNYTLTAAKSSLLPSGNLYDYYNFIITPATLSVVKPKHNLTIDCGQNGYAEPAEGSNFRFGSGSKITINAVPDSGYEVEAWTATAEGESAPYQTKDGGNSFTVNTPESDLTVSVSFREKDTKLRFSADPAGAGEVSAVLGPGGVSGGTIVGSGDLVLENSKVVITAKPNENFTFYQWVVYKDGKPELATGTIDPETGEATLDFTMPGSSVSVLAVFDAARYPITLSENLTASYTYPGTPGVAKVISGDLAPYGAKLTIVPEQGYKVTEWTKYEEDAVRGLDDQGYVWYVKGAGEFAANLTRQYTLKAEQPLSGSITISGLTPSPSAAELAAGVRIDENTAIRLTVAPDDVSVSAAGYWTINGIPTAFTASELDLTMNQDWDIAHMLAKKSAEPLIWFDDSYITCTKNDGTAVPAGEDVEPGTVLTLSADVPDTFRLIRWVSQMPPGTLDILLQEGGATTFTLTMPEFDTLIRADLAEKTYSVTVKNGVFGSYSLDCGAGVLPAAVPVGSTVYLTVTPSVYYLPKVTMTDAFGTQLTLDDIDPNPAVWQYGVTNLSSDITFTIEYTDNRDYEITLNLIGGMGGIIQSSRQAARAGEIINLTAAPDEGYIHNGWNVRTSDGLTAITATDGQFVMPASNVTVSSLFIAKSVPGSITGPAGARGDPGPAGVAGTQGIPGVQGIEGEPGTQGLQGIQGAAGTQGMTGAAGSSGRSGGSSGGSGQPQIIGDSQMPMSDAGNITQVFFPWWAIVLMGVLIAAAIVFHAVNDKRRNNKKSGGTTL